MGWDDAPVTRLRLRAARIEPVSAWASEKAHFRFCAFSHWERSNNLHATMLAGRETIMATSAERMRAPRERARRRIRRLTIDVSEDDLHTLAERGYEGAESPAPQGQAQAVALFVTDAVVLLDSRG